MTRPLLPSRLAWRLPAPLVNGLGIGLGLLLATGFITLFWGWPAAAIASSGFGSTCVADNVCAPRQKWAAMWPAMLSTVLVAALVAASQGHAGTQAAVVLGVTFTALLFTAWGKRGMPQSFVMILSLVFQLAAFAAAPLDTAHSLVHLGWVAVGAAWTGLWAWLCALVLAPRYRTLTLVDSLAQLARLIRAQARWTQDLALATATAARNARSPHAGTEATEAQQTDLLALVRQQAALADVFQSARDLLYSEANTPGDLDRRRQIDALIEVINLRDATLACQIDLEPLCHQAGAQPLLQALTAWLEGHAKHLQEVAEALRLGTALPTAPALAGFPETASPRLEALVRRALHLQEHREALDTALRADDARPHAEAAQLHTLVSPTDWPLAPLRRQLHVRAPVLRYALRTTLAMACALVVSRLLPWHVHPHWLLLTVAVVMRGNLEQTLARRDARVQGTIAGCALATLLLWPGPPLWLLIGVMALSLSLAHAHVQRDYRITTTAAALMALIQAHFFAHGAQSAWQDAAVRLVDTFIGTGIAWGFSYVLPSWERGQWPALVARLRQAQVQYAQRVLQWDSTPTANVLRSHARREVYDVIWLLAQALQRADKEPAYARSHSPQIEDMLVHSHRLVSQLAAVRILLTRRQADLPEGPTRQALQHSADAVGNALQPLTISPRAGTAQADHQVDHPPPQPATLTPTDVATELPSPLADPSPWLRRRLSLIEDEARAWSHSAAGFTPKR